MSDSIVKLIPKNPFCKISNDLLEKATEYLKSKIPSDYIESQCYTSPAFIDCGSNLENITCPICGSVISFDWWQNAMDHAYNNDFMVLETEMPCCNNQVSLNDLKYYFLCGFACFEIDIWNPTINIDAWIIESVEKILSQDINVIRAHL